MSAELIARIAQIEEDVRNLKEVLRTQQGGGTGRTIHEPFDDAGDLVTLASFFMSGNKAATGQTTNDMTLRVGEASGQTSTGKVGVLNLVYGNNGMVNAGYDFLVKDS